MVQFEFNSTVLDLSPAGFSPSQPEMDINWESDTHSIGVSGRFHKISPPPNNYLTFTARGQVLFLVEIIEACGFNQQQARLGILYRVSSPS